jgi:hypothetical protein
MDKAVNVIILRKKINVGECAGIVAQVKCVIKHSGMIILGVIVEAHKQCVIRHHHCII